MPAINWRELDVETLFKMAATDKGNCTHFTKAEMERCPCCQSRRELKRRKDAP